MPGVNLGDITFASGSTDVVYDNRMDSCWCNEAYGKTQTLGVAGCGPTVLAIVVSSLTGTQMNPKEMADWAYEKGYCCEDGGHFIVLRGVTAKGKLLVADPVSYGKRQMEWDAKLVFAETSLSSAARGPLWIVG